MINDVASTFKDKLTKTIVNYIPKNTFKTSKFPC